MKKVILYIATSLDGFVADEKGKVDWLEKYTGKDIEKDYSKFIKGISSIIMGRVTYKQILGFNLWPYKKIPCYVLSHKKMKIFENSNIEFYSEDIKKLLTKVKRKSKKNIWLLGGANVAQKFLKEGLVDEIQLAIIPETLGKGIHLFKKIENKLKLIKIEKMKNGVIITHYKIK